jgi:hypothetical protein
MVEQEYTYKKRGEVKMSCFGRSTKRRSSLALSLALFKFASESKSKGQDTGRVWWWWVGE